MSQALKAIYEDGVLRPLEPVLGIKEHTEVHLVLRTSGSGHPLAGCVGILPDEDAAEMSKIIEGEFERIDADSWS